MRTKVKKMGSNVVVFLPKLITAEYNLQEGDKLEIQSKDGKIILKPCKNKIREGWAEVAKQATKKGDDRIMMNFDNKFDYDEWDW